MIEQDESHSLILAATNHPEILDHALFRRFDDILQYDFPDASRIATLLKARLGRRIQRNTSWNELARIAHGLSYAEIVRACDEAKKEAVIENKTEISQLDLQNAIEERNQTKFRMSREDSEG